MSDRRDPDLGEPVVTDPDDAPRRTPRERPSLLRDARWRWLLGGSLVLLVAIGFALAHWRGAIAARLVPLPQQDRLMRQADDALRAGRLTSPDGHGARELYEAAMARDPDDLAAREGLARVANAALAQAQSAVDAGHPDVAQRDLDLARDLSAPVAAVKRVEDALRGKTGGEARLADLLAKADAAARDGRLDGSDDSALAIYQQAIALAPDNALVLDRRRALLARMLAGADPLLARGDVDDAQKLVDRIAAVDPGDLDLPNARARLADANQRRQRDQSRLLDRADADLRAGKVDDAVAAWRQVLAVSPEEPRAHEGLRAAAEAWVREANREAADFRFPAAQAALEKAHALAPELPSVRVAAQRLQQARQQRAGMEHGVHDRARIVDLLDAADRAIARDELVDPPGESAFDQLHQASAIAPADPRVIAANRRFVATAAGCIQHAMTDNHLAHASACLDALSATQPAYASLPSLRAALAKRWLGYADERIGAGEMDNAQRAVESARRLAPDDPAVAAMAARVRQARGGH